MPLWIVSTPIGTLDDLSPRARQVLADAAVVYCEDTRTTRKLLSALDIAAPALEALHAHNEGARADAVAARAMEQDVALVSDAGTPGVSDPGTPVVAACLAAGVEIRSVPGPSALAAALAASGMPAAPSTFLGFAPRKGRDRFCTDALARPETLVIYEAPTRVADLARRLASVDGRREAVLCRELSKRFEEVIRAPLDDLAARLAHQTVRGECVLVVGPGEPVAPAVEGPTVEAGDGLKQIAEALAARWGTKKREAYQALLALEEARGGSTE